MYNKHKTPIAKDKQILNRICEDCGRYRSIPIRFCNECWKEMVLSINNNKEN